MTASVKRYRELVSRFGIKCYGRSRQIPLQVIDPKAVKGDHMEIDLIGLVKNIGLLIEVTDKKNDNRKKIRRFLRHCELFAAHGTNWKKRLEFFKDIPSKEYHNFESVKDWKFIYFGESLELIEEKITSHNFIEAKGRLFVFNVDEIEYLRSLSNIIGEYARFEFLSALGFKPKDLGERERIERVFQKVENRKLSPDSEVRADMYMLDFSPKELLPIGRVFRYGGVLIPFEEKSKGVARGQYQRILIRDKLNAMATKHIGNDPEICFPNTVTLVLSEGCKEDTSEQGDPVLLIPNHYASIDIIDGQHRIFAYTHEEIDEDTRKNARILATAIRFKTKDEREKQKLAARMFWTINTRQATAKRDLLYLIQYEVLGDIFPEALAGAIICRCSDTKRALGNLFKTHPLRRHNKFDTPAIPITTVVEELARWLNIKKILKDNPILESNVEKLFGKSSRSLVSRPSQMVRIGQRMLEDYFKRIADTFPEDWKPNSVTQLICSNYIAAMIRLLGHLGVEKGLSMQDINSQLQQMKQNIVLSCPGTPGSPTFAPTRIGIPAKKSGTAEIFDFLKGKLP